MSLQRPAERRGSLFRLAADMAVTLAAGTGLGWWAIWLAVARHSLAGWAPGGGALLVIAAGLLVAAPAAGRELDFPAVLTVIGTVLSEAALGWLAVSFATENFAWPTWLFISLAYVVLLLAFLFLGLTSHELASGQELALVIVVVAVAPAATTAGVAGRLAVRGHPGLGWITGGLAIGFVVVLVSLMTPATRLYFSLIMRVLASGWRPRQGRPLAAAGTPPGATASLATQLAGVVLPAGAVAWAAERATHTAGMVAVLTDVAVTGIAVAVLLAAQGLLLAWLRGGPEPSLPVQERIARAVWKEADLYQELVGEVGSPAAPARSSPWPDRSRPRPSGRPEGEEERRWVRSQEHLTRLRDFQARANGTRQRALVEAWDRNWRDAEEQLRALERELGGPAASSWPYSGHDPVSVPGEEARRRGRVQAAPPADRRLAEHLSQLRGFQLRAEGTQERRMTENWDRAWRHAEELLQSLERELGSPARPPGRPVAGHDQEEHLTQLWEFQARAEVSRQREMVARWDSAWHDAEDELLEFTRGYRADWLRPLASAAAARVAVATLFATGVITDLAWPRVVLIMPPGVRRETRRREGYIAFARVLAAGAVCAAVTWPLAAGRAGAGSGPLALLVVAPLLVAVALIGSARRRTVSAYRRRGDVINVYRAELARAMHLQLPEDSQGLRALGRILSSGEPAGGRPLALAPGGPPDGAAGPAGLPESVAEDVSRRVLEDVRDLLAVRDGELLGRVREAAAESNRGLLHEQGVFQERLLGRQQELQEELRHRLEERVHEVVRASVEDAVSGPPLANFAGYVAIELDRRNSAGDAVRGSKGTLIAPAGQEVSLIMSVVRDPRALAVPPTVSAQPDKPFYVLEPFDIQGGRDARVADFLALAESPTLTPLPHRKDLRVEKEAQAAFTVKLPDEAGTHEVWFQLYQAGRLVQVTAVRVEARPGEPPTVTG